MTNAGAATGFALPQPGLYELDAVHSFLYFSVQHLVIGRVRGRFNGFFGQLTVADDLDAWRLEVWVDTATVDTQNGRRDEDLRSTRFLDSEHYPRMTFSGRGIAAEPGSQWSMLGDLTIRDVARPVALKGRFIGQVPDRSGTSRIGFEAQASIKRRDFALDAELDGESGGLPVAHDIEVSINAELVRRTKTDAPVQAVRA